MRIGLPHAGTGGGAEGPSSTPRPAPGGLAPGRRGTSRGAQAPTRDCRSALYGLRLHHYQFEFPFRFPVLSPRSSCGANTVRDIHIVLRLKDFIRVHTLISTGNEREECDEQP